MGLERAPEHFKANAKAALADRTLKVAIDRTTGTAERKRAEAVAAFPEFPAARDRGRAIRDHVLANLDHYLLEFEKNATAAGSKVHWAATADEACRIVVAICREAGARRVTRAKSMLGEEIGLPHALAEAGDRAGRDRSRRAHHPARRRPAVPHRLARHAPHPRAGGRAVQGPPRPAARGEEAEDLVASARRELRAKFLSAEVGISGANFLIADTGAACTVTNEGNAELTTTPPKVHIVTAGDREAAALDRARDGDAAPPRALGHRRRADPVHDLPLRPEASGRRRRARGDARRPGRQRPHADAGRPALREMLRCIRCGACMNHCVVYRQIGGHAYGSTYPGPMGAVLTPALDGLAKSRDLPHACTMNGRCQEVCPVAIPLPTLLRGWRDRSWREGLEPASVRAGLAWWAYLARHPRLYRAATSAAVRSMRILRRGGWIRSLPMAQGWTGERDFPAPPGRTFMEEYKAGKRR